MGSGVHSREFIMDIVPDMLHKELVYVIGYLQVPVSIIMDPTKCL
jgi:hypothetical protein